MRNEAWAALQDESTQHEQRTRDLYHTAMHVYSIVRDGLAMAIEGEYQRNKLIERRMRGAGLIIPANGPVTKWHTLWVETGACTEPTPEGKIQQLVLGTPTFHFRRGIATVRHDIRPDRCPPTVPPPNTLHLYLGTAGHGHHSRNMEHRHGQRRRRTVQWSRNYSQ